MLVVLVPAFTVTAVFLHQLALADRMAWSSTLLPLAFVVFAAAQAVANFAAGRIVDGVGVLPVTRLYLLPLAAAVLVIATIEGASGQLLAFGLLGLSSGTQGVVGGALWMQLFGPRQLGLVRGVYAAAMVFATAVSPWLLGLVLGAGTSLLLVAAVIAAWSALVPWLVQPVLRRHSTNSRRGLSATADEIDNSP